MKLMSKWMKLENVSEILYEYVNLFYFHTDYEALSSKTDFFSETQKFFWTFVYALTNTKTQVLRICAYKSFIPMPYAQFWNKNGAAYE